MGMESQLSARARQQLDRFNRQYFQLHLDLNYPDEEQLRNDVFQQELYTRVFSEDIKHAPPARYQIRILKELTRNIEESIRDWDEEVCYSLNLFYMTICSPYYAHVLTSFIPSGYL